MNVNQLINMVLRIFARKAVNTGVRHIAKRGQEPGQARQSPKLQQQRSVQATQRRARRGLNMARRFTKF